MNKKFIWVGILFTALSVPKASHASCGNVALAPMVAVIDSIPEAISTIRWLDGINVKLSWTGLKIRYWCKEIEYVEALQKNLEMACAVLDQAEGMATGAIMDSLGASDWLSGDMTGVEQMFNGLYDEVANVAADSEIARSFSSQLSSVSSGVSNSLGDYADQYQDAQARYNELSDQYESVAEGIDQLEDLAEGYVDDADQIIDEITDEYDAAVDEANSVYDNRVSQATSIFNNAEALAAEALDEAKSLAQSEFNASLSSAYQVAKASITETCYLDGDLRFVYNYLRDDYDYDYGEDRNCEPSSSVVRNTSIYQNLAQAAQEKYDDAVSEATKLYDDAISAASAVYDDTLDAANETLEDAIDYAEDSANNSLSEADALLQQQLGSVGEQILESEVVIQSVSQALSSAESALDDLSNKFDQYSSEYSNLTDQYDSMVNNVASMISTMEGYSDQMTALFQELGLKVTRKKYKKASKCIAGMDFGI